MSDENIIISGAREHNLKNVSVVIPRNKLTVITGLSGSGKSSLAFDTLFAEGQRRYVESLSAYARQFLDQLGRPDVDFVDGLSPAISIEQHSASSNPRSIVATSTEIMDYLRLLYANAGLPHCPKCGREVRRQSAEQIVEDILRFPDKTKLTLYAPVARHRKGDLTDEIKAAISAGFVRIRIDGETYDIEEVPVIDKSKKHSAEIVVDRLVMKPEIRSRLTDSVELALKQGSGIISLAYQLAEGVKPIAVPNSEIGKAGRRDADAENVPESSGEIVFSEKNVCPDCGIAFEELKAANFSFNSPIGACPVCAGIGNELYFDEKLIVPDEDKSLAKGAIHPWRRGPRRLVGAYNMILRSVCESCGIDINAPWNDLPEEQRKIILHGSGDEDISIFMRVRGSIRKNVKPFEGVIPNLHRRMSESPSDYVRYMLREYMSYRRCSACGGKRLKPESLVCTVGGRGIMDFLSLSVRDALCAANGLSLSNTQQKIVGQALDEIQKRLHFLDNVGLGYLTLDRESGSLSGGESQRIRLATQIGSALVGVLYVLDEPTIGLHPRDTGKLIGTLRDLQKRGNTVVVVEHDEAMIREADHVIDMGPGAGREGGEVVFEGDVPTMLRDANSLTGRFLCGKERIPVPTERHLPGKDFIVVKGAKANNLKNVSVKFPLGCFIAVTGVSGSGKSSLVNEVLLSAIRDKIGNKLVVSEEENAEGLPSAERSGTVGKLYSSVTGLDKIDKVIVIDQNPIGRTPRSNPATYTGAFGTIRDLFATLPSAKARGYKSGRFSFNVKGGRCEVCKGEGMIRLEMNFLPDVYVPCEQCGGHRYNRETLEVKYAGHSISDVLAMTVDEAVDVFSHFTKLSRIFKTLSDVGLGYVQLGQSSTTLSGGEAQRVKLATELCRPPRGHTLYLLDEPTTGLHFADVRKLLEVLMRLRNMGHTVLVIEHNPDVMKVADHIIDLGPEGGDEGGNVVATGTPEAVAKVAGSRTGKFLAEIL